LVALQLQLWRRGGFAWRSHPARHLDLPIPPLVLPPGVAGRTQHLHPQPRHRSLKPCDIALAPLVAAQHLGRFGRRHAEGLANLLLSGASAK
jgi:hypothetical protein